MGYASYWLIALIILVISANAAKHSLAHISKVFFGRDLYIPRWAIHVGGIVGLLSGYYLAADIFGLPKFPSFITEQRAITEKSLLRPNVETPSPPSTMEKSQPLPSLEQPPRNIASSIKEIPPTQSSQNVRPQRDIFEETITRNSTPTTLRISVVKTPQVQIDYLCNGGYTWWAYKLTDPRLTWASIILTGLSKYNSYDAGGQPHGQGVFMGYEPGPLVEHPERRSPNQMFIPLSFASMEIRARGDGFTQTIPIGRLPQATVDQLSRCLGLTFPRVLHKKPTIRY